VSVATGPHPHPGPLPQEGEGARLTALPLEGRGEGGYTLLELVITLLVLALAGAVTAPSVSRGMEGLRARAEVSGFAAFLRAAREQAVTRGEPQEVRVDPESRTLALAAANAGPDAVVRASRRFPSLVRIDAEPASALSIMFAPEGFSSGGQFTIQATGNRRYLVTVDVLTGRVSSRLTDS